MGSLNVTANPPAQTISITGPEFSLTLHDSTGTNVSVPTDSYHVTAQYARWSDAKDYLVTPNYPMPCSFSPQLGVLFLTCNQAGATYQVRDANGNNVEAGNLPAIMVGLPSAIYQLTVAYHNYQLQRSFFVAANQTNHVPFQFLFGAALLESVPPGAAVYNHSGNNLGKTPLRVIELRPGPTEFKLQLNGYDDATVAVTVAADQTNTASTNLVNTAYIANLGAARQYMAAGDYRRAMIALEQSLNASPGDTEALGL